MWKTAHVVWATTMALGTLTPLASAQEVPESSLSDSFPVADHSAIWQTRAGSERLPSLGSPSPGHAAPPANGEVDTGDIILGTTIGTLAGDLAGLYVFIGCGLEWCDTDEEVVFNLVGAGVLAVGGAAIGAILGGGDPAWSFVGSAGGSLIGLGLLATVGDGEGLLLALAAHATMTAAAAML